MSVETKAAPNSMMSDAFASLRKLAPGLGFAAVISIVAYIAAPLVAKVAPIPAIIIALIIGVALNPVAVRPIYQPGITFAVKKILRWAVALLGLKIALGDI